MILKSPFDTTILKAKNIEEIKNQIQISLIDNWLTPDEDNIVRLEKDWGSAFDIKAFEQPITVNHPKIGLVTVVDMRFFSSFNKQTDEVRVRAPNEYSCALMGARYHHRWQEGNVRPLLSLNSSILASYANWVSALLTKKLVLDIHETKFLKVLSAWFYVSHFFDKTLNEADQLSMYELISRSIRVSTQEVIQILTNIPLLNDLKDFAQVITEQSNSKRLSRITTGIIVSTLIASWFGVNSSTIVSVAIEYPPTWMALMHTALVFSMYKKTLLGMTVINTVGNNKDTLIRALNNIH